MGQPLPENSYDNMYYFIYKIIKLRKKLEILDDTDNLNRIINVDETPVFLELIPDKTYNIKGAKEVIIDTKGNEKKHVTVILSVTGGGVKLPPVIVFKEKCDKKNEKRYSALDVVKDKRIFIYFQDNAWINDYIFLKWLDNIYLSYQNRINKKCLLLFDRAPSHLTREILNHLEINNIEFSFIPAKLTRFLQPIDIGINKQFKSYLKNKYLINEANKLTNNVEINPIKFNDKLSVSNLDLLRLNLINWLFEIWEDNSLIKPSSIISSFKKATITYPLDGSLDNEFEMPEEIVKQYNK